MEEADLAVATRRRRSEADERLQREEAAMLARDRLGQLVGEIKAAVDDEDYDMAAALKKEAATLKQEMHELTAEGDEAEEAQRTSRCLRLAALLLQGPTLELADHELAELPARFVPSV